ncbi:phytoene desaturase family protein [Nocardia sp. alder85J]|uniref:phytoene desaturase family protein n=1 Tax=Nocardia sp. alder85J TaxID=2862949 RepID=UPI001CD601D5|nr:phytoene desaturase family protein [Nocardia sp. alder85J]MCX4094714.1 phytoene desaturase family protein [Nocardia sp. alder85J]
MRTISGRSDHIVVVGAGLAGLSAALHLAGRGRTVTVLERDTVPGGRTGRADVDGYRLDTGPTVLTMPDLIEEVFAAVGERMRDRLILDPVEPAYRARYADGRWLEVHTDTERMAAAVADFAGPAQADGYRRLRDWLTRLYHAEFDRFIAANFDSPLSMLNPALGRLVALGGFRHWDRAVARHIGDPELRRLFTFQSLYAGVTPARALAAYAVIAYMDTIGGVYFPRGGMRALPDALAAAAEAAGVRLRYATTVTGTDRVGSRVRAVVTASGERIACDAVVLTSELADSHRLLSHRSRRPLGPVAAPSAVVLHLGVAAAPELGHHTLLFGRAWEETFRDITVHGRVMRDPSLLVTRPTAGDPTLAPPGRELLYLLAPVPNLARGRINWDRFGPAYARELLATAGDRLTELPDAHLLRVTTPADWARQGMLAGSPFALAHTFAQTGPFRPANLIRGLDNVVLAGGSTVPGVGIPPVLVSGRLAADRITGVGAASVSYPGLVAAAAARLRTFAVH